ncbi:MAG: hypothetical protein HQM09_15150 [Candidatus Riflebacteria bacterium]|nr:hypothetical protein [Candidatus Riflebacteria bacterium]
MKNLPLSTRAELYHKAFPKFQLLRADDVRLEGLWIMGNNYRTSGYYGAYPHGYLPRVMSMFPDAERVLHVPSGSLPPGDYTRIDIRPEGNPDIVGDCHDCKSLLGDRTFDLVMVDVPYSNEDALNYGRPMVNRIRVLRSVLEVMEPGGYIVWLDQAPPIHRKAESLQVGSIIVLPMVFEEEGCSMVGGIGMQKSTNHRVRGIFIFRKEGGR